MEMPIDCTPPLEIQKQMYDCWTLDPEQRPHISTVSRNLEAVAKTFNINLKKDPITLTHASDR